MFRFRRSKNSASKDTYPQRVHKGTTCPAWDGRPDSLINNCIHPDGPCFWKQDISMFADEPHNYRIHGECKHRMFCGPSVYYLRSMTKEQHDQFMANHTVCRHPAEYGLEHENYCEWRP